MYKKIVIPRRISESDAAAIVAFNARLNREHLYLEHNGKALTIFLRQADIKKVETIADELLGGALKAAVGEIKKIKSYGLKSGRRVYLDYNQERKVQNRAAKAQNRGKHFYANAHVFTQDDNLPPDKYVNQIVCADSLRVLSQLPDNCVDLILTSPPYNFGLDYDNDDKDDNFWRDYFAALFKIFDEGIRVLKYGGRFIVNVQPLYSDFIPSHHIICNHFMNKKMIWKGEVIWEKNNYNCKYSAWGSWKSPSNPYLKGTWEFLEIFCKGSLKKTGERDNIDIDAEEFKKWVISRWSIAPERKMKDYGHPAMFPEKLVERALKLFSYQNDFIVDPFNGAGTTTAVAKRLNRRWLGVDISREYCATAEMRTQNTKQLSKSP